MSNIIPKATLAEALSKVEQIEALVEDGTSLDDAVALTLGDTTDLAVDKAAGLTDAIDRYLAVFGAFKAKQDYIESIYNTARARRQSVKAAFERFKDRIQFFMDEHPQIMLQGTEMGFRQQRNGGKAKMVLKFDTYLMSNLVTDEVIDEHKIPQHLYNVVKVKILNVDAVRAHMEKSKPDQQLIENGKYVEGGCDFGYLERGQSLRVK